LQSADLADSINYDFAHGDDLIDEVLKERALTQNTQIPQNNPLQPNQSALAREAKSVHDAYHHDEDDNETIQQSDENDVDRKRTTIATNKKYTQDQNAIPQIKSSYYSLLAKKESNDNYNMVLKSGGGIGAIGKYQLRMPAFKETGYMDVNGNFTGKNGINSVEDFLNKPEIQEKAISEFTKRNYDYMKHYKVLSMIGLEVEGIKENFQITLSGILAAAHKEGGPQTALYLKSLEKNKDGAYYMPYHKLRGDKVRSFKAIETRLREFSKIDED